MSPALAWLVWTGCHREPQPPPPVEQPCGLQPAPDLDPDPEVVEVELRAAPFAWDPGTGQPVTDGLAFGRQVPGPTLVVERGQRLRVDFLNDTEAETTLHWHGLRVPEDQDGISQMADPVRPGEQHVYEFEVPDAGLYWYHPHMDTDSVLERGLYGTIWVRDPAEPEVDCLSVVVLDDLLVGPDGAVGSAEPVGGMGGMSAERLGDTLLANGQADLHTRVAPGASVLLAVINAANARYFDLSLQQHAMEVVGTDGGWLAAPFPVSSLLVAPGERWLLHFVAGEAGEYALTTGAVELHDDSMGGMGGMGDPLGSGSHRLWTLEVQGEPVQPEPLLLPQAEVLPSEGEFVHTWVLDEDGGMGMTFTIDGEQWPDVPLVQATLGVPARFVVENRSSMRHPFHLHGQRFAVQGGEEISRLGWKDTLDVPAGETISFVTEADNPGEWLYHCHILEHAEDGMAGILQVR
jgi:FtsP/CotA-like multicopper oxidase with cupredoxin domain